MKRGIGIRPASSERDLPEARVRIWVIDTSGVKDLSGQPLKRTRWEVKGLPRSSALDLREHRIARLLQGLPPIDPEAETRFFPKIVPEPEPEAPPPPPVAIPVEDTTPLMRDYITERYMPWHRGVHAEGTCITKGHIHRRHILPQLGNYTLKQASSVETLQAFYTYLSQAKESRTGEDLKTGFKNKILAELSAIFTHASNRRTCTPPLIEPVQVETFRERRSKIVDQSGLEVGHLRDKALPQEDVLRLLNTCRNSADHPTLAGYSSAYWYVLVGLGLYAGCRVGEAAGRRWCDIDFDEGLLTIATKISSETDEFEDHTKNFIGGVILLAPPMIDALRRLREEKSAKEEDFILGGRIMRLSRTPTDKPWLSPRNLRDRYALLALAAWGEEKANGNYHALRHTFATTLADAGVPVNQIQRACRHANLQQTMGYIHPRASAVAEATGGIDYSPKLQVIRGGKKRIGGAR